MQQIEEKTISLEMDGVHPSQGFPELNWLPVLMYHRVGPRREDYDPYCLCTSVEDFEAQIRYLKERGYRSIHLDELAHTPVQRDNTWGKPVVITFDDGYMDTFLHAFPVLQKYGFTADVFLVSSRINDSNTWDRAISGRVPLLGEKELQEMARYGISLGSHSVSHRWLTRLSPQEAWEEIAGSKTSLEQSFGKEVRSFSFPYGSSAPALQQMVKEAGYLAACGIEQRQHTLFNISRIDAASCRGAGLRWQLHSSGLYFQMRRNRAVRMLKPFIDATGLKRLSLLKDPEGAV